MDMGKDKMKEEKLLLSDQIREQLDEKGIRYWSNDNI